MSGDITKIVDVEGDKLRNSRVETSEESTVNNFEMDFSVQPQDSYNINSTECSKYNCDNCSQLQDKLKDEQKRCTILRANIHKVSANWFQRKTQISESELDTEIQPVGLLNETTKIGSEESDEDDEDKTEINTSKSKENKPSVLSKDFTKLVGIIAQKSAQLEVSDSQCYDLKKRMREYEKIIDNKEDVIHGLKDQLETYLTDNQNMSIQLNNLAALFQQLEKVEKEIVAPPQVSEEEEDTAPTTVPLPTRDDFQEMASSVSRTYIKLKDLIYEKKALVTEIERLNTLNVELQRRVVQQETRLVSVSDALHQTWLVVSDLKEDHEKLHNDELILRYELKEKKEILSRLRKELESARSQWQVIRQKNLESEQEYASIRAMLQERRKTASDEAKESDLSSELDTENSEPDDAVGLHPDDAKSFDPPVDLLLEMGLEYGIIGEEAEMTQTVLDVIGGEDVRNSRLEQLEEHCSLLYQKLIASTSRSLSLASRLSRLHQHFGPNDEEFDEHHGEGEDIYYEEDGVHEDDEDDQDDEEDEEEAQYFTDANHMAIMESVLSSPDSEEYDTAYVSETEGAEIQTELAVASTISESVPSTSAESRSQDSTEESNDTKVTELTSEVMPYLGRTSESSDTVDYEESCDHLSRALINFLPKKIEFLKVENTRLEESINAFKEERSIAEDRAKCLEEDKSRLEEELKVLTRDMALEIIQRKQLEEQLKHLGKCVDELKLKHQAESQTKTDRGCNTDMIHCGEKKEYFCEHDILDSAPLKRPQEEKTIEDNKMKREVELVKKDMELKKKEKEIRKREEELTKRMDATTRAETLIVGETSKEQQEVAHCISKSNSDDAPSSGSSFDCSANDTNSNDLLLDLITDLIRKKINVPSTSDDEASQDDEISTDDNCDSKETDSCNAVSTSGLPRESKHIPSLAIKNSASSTSRQGSFLNKIRVQPIVNVQELLQSGSAQTSESVDLESEEIITIPLHIAEPESGVSCEICPSKEAYLILIQVPSGVYKSTSSTASNPPTASTPVSASSPSQVLIPLSRVPATTVHLSVVAHKSPGTFVIVLTGARNGELRVVYRFDPKQQ